jgi:ferredoxin-NADP reductase
MGTDLDSLASQYPTRFQWTPVISSRTGRISANEDTLIEYLKPKDATNSVTVDAIRSTHYHLIGNGQLVNEWKAGLDQAGVPKERVTVEAYFNTFCDVDQSAIDTIAETVKKVAATTSAAATTTNVSQPAEQKR